MHLIPVRRLIQTYFPVDKPNIDALLMLIITVNVGSVDSHPAVLSRPRRSLIVELFHN